MIRALMTDSLNGSNVDVWMDQRVLLSDSQWVVFSVVSRMPPQILTPLLYTKVSEQWASHFSGVRMQLTQGNMV